MYGKLQQILRDVNASPYTTFLVNIFPSMDADECANVDSKGSADSHDQRVLKETEDDLIKKTCADVFAKIYIGLHTANGLTNCCPSLWRL